MHLRPATPDDVDAIRGVADVSLSASYGHVIDESVIDEAVDLWYDSAELSEDIAATTAVFLVAVVEDDVVGFAESYVSDRRERVGEIDWLHVHPDYRGEGLGAQLLDRVESELREAGVDRIEGRVLIANKAGTQFYEQEGYERSGEQAITVDRDTFHERRYVKRFDDDAVGAETETLTTEDGERVYVAFDESDRGSDAPFYAVYLDPDHEERYGYHCGNCRSLDVVVDTMDSVECNACGNRRKPSRWDAAYL